MICKIMDNKDSHSDCLIRKKGVLLLAAIFILFSLWAVDVNRISYAEETGLELNFKDTPIETILGYLSEKAGVVVVTETSLTDRITVISKQAVTLDEAVSLINTILQEKGYTAVRTGKNLKIATISEAKKLSIPIYTGNDPKALPESDDVITCIIPIASAKVDTLQENLTGFLSENADFTANTDTNTLIVTDTANNIRRIMEIIKAIDTNIAAVAEIRVFRLKYADAEDTAELINELFEEQGEGVSGSSRMQGFVQQMMRGANQQVGGMPGQQTGAQSAGQSSTSVSVTAKGDERTNSVVVSASSNTMDVIEKMIEELDSDSSAGEAVFVYRLKNAQASNLVDVLNNLFSEMSSSTTQATGAQGQVGDRDGMPGQAASQSSTASSSSTGLVGDVFIEADEDTNSLIIMTSPANYVKVKGVLDELDQPVPQVLIKVLIAEVTHDGLLDLGTEFSFLNNWDENNITVDSDFSIGSLTSGGVATIVGEKFDVKLRALAEKGKLNILSKPYILASNNQTASITVGNEVPFITDSRITETGQTINTIDYEDIGIILEVTPVINNEGLVTMDVSQEISAISDTTVKISETVDAAVFAKRSSENRVIARSGQTVVIGGLMEDRKTDSVRKVPLLGDIPVLGALFRHREKDNTKTELLIFITPTVAANDKELVDISNEKKIENTMIDNVYSKKDLGFEDEEVEVKDADALEEESEAEDRTSSKWENDPFE